MGPVWRLAVLIGNQYGTSRQFFASNADDLQRLVFAMRHLKVLILGR